MQSVSTLIARLRAAGLSQAEIARRASMSQPQVSRWAAGLAPKSADDALRIRELVAGVIPASSAIPAAGEGTTTREAA
jgi:transcriptional regulator with XRE-family HTH domain